MSSILGIDADIAFDIECKINNDECKTVSKIKDLWGLKPQIKLLNQSYLRDFNKM